MTYEAKRIVDGMREGNFTHLADLIESLAAELEQVKQERDAAIADIPRACGYCKHYVESAHQCTNNLPCAHVSGVNTRWQWRGVKEG